MYPDSSKAINEVTYVLDSIGARYKKSNNLSEIITSLSIGAQRKLYEELLRRKEWSEFQRDVYNWVLANHSLAITMKSKGLDIKMEHYMNGYSGLTYRFDIAGYGRVSRYGLLGETYFIAIECKMYKHPVPETDIMIFKSKIEDVLLAMEKKPDEDKTAIMMFSSSGYTNRALQYVKKTCIYGPSKEYPIYLYAKHGKTYTLLAKTEME